MYDEMDEEIEGTVFIMEHYIYNASADKRLFATRDRSELLHKLRELMEAMPGRYVVESLERRNYGYEPIAQHEIYDVDSSLKIDDPSFVINVDE